MAGYLKTLVDSLAGLELPIPIARYFAGEPCPLSLTTRERLPGWCEAHNYSDDQRQTLNEIVRVIATRDVYLRALLSGANRVDLDGQNTAEPITEAAREYATAQLAASAKKQRKLAKAAQASKAAPEPTSIPTAPIKAPVTENAPTALPEAVEPLPTPPEPVRTRAAARHRATPVVVLSRSSRSAAARTPLSALQLSRSAKAPVAKPLSLSPTSIPTIVIREAVERVNGRRNAIRMITTHLKAGRLDASDRERVAWIADSIKMLTADGYDAVAVAIQVPQMIDYMLVDVLPRRARQ